VGALGVVAMIRDWFHKSDDGEEKSPEQKGESRLRLFSSGGFNREKLIDRLNPNLQFFARSFYNKFDEILPEEFQFAPDKKAPRDAQCLHPDPNQSFKRISMEYRFLKGARAAKFGTGRVELRDHLFFAKTVTWWTPKDFLHQRTVYEIIKLYYEDSRIMPSKSRSANGFALKSPKHVITLEVFGDDDPFGFLACDISLNGNNQPLAVERMQYFLEFYGAIYNLLGRQDLLYKVKPKLPRDLEVEYVEDYQSEQEKQSEEG